MGKWNGFILDYCPSRERFIVVLHRGAADDMTATNFYQYPWQTEAGYTSSSADYPEYEIVSAKGYAEWLFNENFQTVWDLTTCPWYEDMHCTDEAEDRIKYWLSLRDGVVNYINKDDITPNSDKLFGYQWDNASIARMTGHVFINDGTGLGKTRSALHVLDNNFRMGPNIIVCPHNAIPVWKSELEEFWGAGACDYIVIEGKKREREAQLLHVEDVDFVIISYNNLISHIGCDHWVDNLARDKGELDDIKWNSVIVDESHRIKNPKAARTRCCWRLAKEATYRIALTATPMTIDPQDLWAQLRFLSPREFPHITHFRRRFLDMEKGFHGGLECKGWNENGQENYEAVMGWRTTRRKFEDRKVSAALSHMTVPEEAPLRIQNIELGSQQKRAYNRMVKHLVSIDEDGQMLVAKNIAERYVRLRQIANGRPVLNDRDEVVGLNMPSNKVPALKQIIEDADCKIVVFAEHSKVVGLMYRELSDCIFDRPFHVITGDTKTVMRQHIIKEFQEGPERDVLICTTGTMSESVSLTSAGLVVFAQEPASSREMIQCRGRVRRIGSTIVVPAIALRSEGTIEVSLAGKVKDKLKYLSDYIANGEKAFTNLLLGKE